MKPVHTPKELTSLEARLGYEFRDTGLAIQALTHMSGAGGDSVRQASYQRLEFLGDRVLGLAVSSMLYTGFPHAAEGELSRRLAQLVRQESCAKVGLDWDLGAYIRLGLGELQAGGRGRPAILADVCEALIGAVYLDGGFEAAAGLIARFWTERMLTPPRPLRDAKTALQEWVQGLGRPPPVYKEIERAGPAHAPAFVVSVAVPGYAAAEGHGPSKRSAEQAAAETFMAREGFGDRPVLATGDSR